MTYDGRHDVLIECDFIPAYPRVSSLRRRHRLDALEAEIIGRSSRWPTRLAWFIWSFLS
jgi:hypothetical protein